AATGTMRATRLPCAPRGRPARAQIGRALRVPVRARDDAGIGDVMAERFRRTTRASAIGAARRRGGLVTEPLAVSLAGARGPAGRGDAARPSGVATSGDGWTRVERKTR